jgi:hypothetical protein
MTILKSNNEYSMAVFLDIMIWRNVLSFLPNFKELAEKTRILLITKMYMYLDINFESDIDVYFSKLVIPNEFWKVPIDIIEIGRYIAKGVISTMKSNTTLQRKNRPLRIPRNPNYYFSNLNNIDSEIKRMCYNNRELSREIRCELMIFLYLFSLINIIEMKKMRMRNIRYIIEKYISDHQSHQDTQQMEKCITCDTMTFFANYTDLLSTVYTVKLCSQCNRILSNA